MDGFESPLGVPAMKIGKNEMAVNKGEWNAPQIHGLGHHEVMEGHPNIPYSKDNGTNNPFYTMLNHPNSFTTAIYPIKLSRCFVKSDN